MQKNQSVGRQEGGAVKCRDAPHDGGGGSLLTELPCVCISSRTHSSHSLCPYTVKHKDRENRLPDLYMFMCFGTSLSCPYLNLWQYRTR